MTRIAAVCAAIIIAGFFLWFIFTLGQRGFDPDEPDEPEPVEQIRPVPPVVPLPTTTVPPTTTAVARSAPTTHAAALRAAPVGELQDLIRTGFARFGAAVAEEAVRVAGCESTGDETGQHLDPAAVNGQHAGLFQLSRTYHEDRAIRLGFTWDQMFEAQPNITVAADLFAEKGRWSPTWTCSWAAA